MAHRSLVLLLCAVLGMQPAYPQQAPTTTRRVTIHKGSYLKFETMRTVDSGTANVGDIVPLRLMRPLVLDNITVLQSGQTINGTITKVKKAGANCRYGEIDFEVDRIFFQDRSSARVKVGQVYNWGRDVPLPDYFTPPSTGVGEIFALLPAMPLILLFAGLRALGDRVDSKDEQKYRCTAPGQEYVLPGRSTVGLWITKDHRVRVEELSGRSNGIQ